MTKTNVPARGARVIGPCGCAGKVRRTSMGPVRETSVEVTLPCLNHPTKVVTRTIVRWQPQHLRPVQP